MTTAATTAPRASRRATVWQLVRYVINGIALTLLYDVVYTAVVQAHASVQIANLLGFLVSVVTGYLLHSRVTFRNQGRRGRRTQLRFAAASLVGFAINAFWTWLFAQHFRVHPLAPLVPITTVTPILLFSINRWWVFR